MKSFSKIIRRYRIIDRHRNPWGIFLRIPVYILLFFALWEHNFFLILISFICEVFLWLFIPPVTKTFSFIERTISVEIKWLKSPATLEKIISYVLLLSAVLSVIIGLWENSIYITSSGFFLLMLFNILMNYIAKKN